jgi:hypothetical protein
MLPPSSSSDQKPNIVPNKYKLYMQLQEDFYLPPLRSKGVTKIYLQQAIDRSVFLVDRQRMARFLADLPPSKLAKVEHSSKLEIFLKLQTILAERKLKPLGFAEGVIPDGTWLLHVARFIDEENMSCIFRMDLKKVLDSKTNSERVHLLQVKVAKELLEDTGLGKRSPVKRCIEELHRSYRKVMGRECRLIGVNQYKLKLERQLQEEHRELGQILENSTVIMHDLLQQQKREGQNGEEAKLQDKDRIREALMLVYTVDRVLRRDDDADMLAAKFTT